MPNQNNKKRWELSEKVRTRVSRSTLSQQVLCLVLFVAVLATSQGVIYSTHLSRQLFAQWQHQQRQALILEQEWGRLLLEESTWGAHNRIRQIAETQLQMVVPTADAIHVVRDERR